jgi:hypothetical protein
MLTTMIISAALWSLWKLINEMCFQNLAWKDAGELPRSISMVHGGNRGYQNSCNSIKSLSFNLSGTFDFLLVKKVMHLYLFFINYGV